MTKIKLLSEKQTQTNQSALYQKISYCEGDDIALQLPKKNYFWRIEMRNFYIANWFAPINNKFLENPERLQNCSDEKITHGLV